MKKHWKIFRKNSMEIFRNFPEKYEIFWTNFPPHITSNNTPGVIAARNLVCPKFYVRTYARPLFGL